MPHSDPEKKKAYQSAYAKRPEVAGKKRETYKAWAARNGESIRQREASRRLKKRAMCLIATARTRAKKKGIPFDLDLHVGAIQSIIDAGICQITGVPFDLSPGRKFNSPSIDRIDPRKGYLFGNVRVILHLMNAALGDWGEEKLIEVMKTWKNGNAINPFVAAEFVAALLDTIAASPSPASSLEGGGT